MMPKCHKCKNGDVYTDLYTGGKGFDCLKQRELEKIVGENIEDVFDGKLECPLFEERGDV